MKRPFHRLFRGVASSRRVSAALVLVLAAMVIGIPAALAHHPVVSGDVACSVDGHAVVTWHLQNSETLAGTNRTMIVDSAALTSGTLSGFGAGTVVTPQDIHGAPVVNGTSSYPGSQSGTVTLTVVAHWVDTLGNYVSSVGHVTKTAIVTLPGSCPLPSIRVDKTATPSPASLGQTVSYGYTVTNTGNVQLTGVTLTDDKLGVITLGTTTLAAGAFTTGTATHVVVLVDFPGPINNTATATGTPPQGPNVTDTDTAHVTLMTDPGITIVKTATSVGQPGVQDINQAHPGDAVVYHFKVTNTGDVPLTNVNVNDVPLGHIGGIPSIASLAVGQYTTLDFPTVAGNDTENVATACGTDPLSKQVCGTSNHHLVDVLHPAISLDKKVEGADHKPVGDALVVHSGALVHYVVTITNTGDTPLTISSLTDTLKASLPTTCTPSPSAPLAMGAHITCSYTATPTADAHNVSSVTATDTLGGDPGTVTASDETFIDVIHPAITLDKTVDNGDHKPVAEALVVHSADLVGYKVTVTNTGDTPLSISSLTDEVNGGGAHALSGCTPSPSSPLAPAAHITCEYTANPTQDAHNVASVTAVDSLGGPDGTVSASDETFVDVIHPGITVVKTATSAAQSGVADIGQAHPGETVVYHFSVHNSGDVPLTNVTVVDVPLGTIGTIATLAVGATDNSLTKTIPAPATDLFNTATACGKDPLQASTCGSDDHLLDIINPGIDVTKTAWVGDSQITSAHIGDTVTYHFDVHNTGDATLTAVNVDDSVFGHIGGTPSIASIAPGATVTLTKDVTLTAEMTTTDEETGVVAVDNTATGCGIDPVQTQLCDQDFHHLPVLHPALTIDKKVSGADHKPVADALVAHQGDPLGYTVLITNTGDAPLTITALSDTLKSSLPDSCDKQTGDTLAAGESMSCSYTTPAGATDAHNVVSVTGVDELGGGSGTVAASDETFVHVIHPAISIVKTANPKTVEPGQDVTYTYVVTNTGDTTLTDVAVTDDVLGLIGSVASLPAGESVTLTRTVTVQADSARTNVGTACGLDSLSLQVCAGSKATISIVLPVAPQRRAPAPRVTVTPPRTLPHTGFRLFLWVAMAMDLMAAGFVMMQLQRRARRT